MNLKSNCYVIILAAGFATRLRPLSNRIPKPLIEINGQTLLSRIITNFTEAGFSKFIVVVGYKKELIKEKIACYGKLDISFIEQETPSGMAEAVGLAIEEVNEISKKNMISHYFITAADILFSKEEILKMYLYYQKSNSDMVLSLMMSNDIEVAKGHGNVKLSKQPEFPDESAFQHNLKITDVIEKPEPNQILSEYYSLPLYLVNKKIVGYLKSVKISERGEKEFQDAIKLSLSHGDNVQGINIINKLITIDNVGQYHLTNLRDIIIMNKRFMKATSIAPLKGYFPKVVNPITIKENNAIGKNSVIGPYVSIGKYCNIGDYCTLSNVILCDGVSLGKHCFLEWCFIDNDVVLPRSFKAKNCFITKKEKNNFEIINF
ncbi:MAG: sugar phosphate nucleotidyltransferase [Promethearchaeota archaeon]|jgi:NDP-sugar pyrophosphorylase family protein